VTRAAATTIHHAGALIESGSAISAWSIIIMSFKTSLAPCMGHKNSDFGGIRRLNYFGSSFLVSDA
jgi:hypothetical protein